MTDKQKKLLAKYSRIGEDKSQLQQFTKDVITGEIGGGGSGGEEKPLKTISFEMGYSDFTPITSKVFYITNQSLIPLIDDIFETKTALSYKISGENGNSMYATQECVCLYVEDIDGEHFCIYDRDDQTKTLKRCFIVSRIADYYSLTLDDLSNCPAGEIVNYCMNNNLKMNFEFTLPISSGSGGSVEAEPIVSIKMTNMDLRPADDSSSTELDNVQLYCTKETWNNMVAYAKQLSSSLDITYDNFGTIYATLPTRTQGALVGFLMMDYLNGKVLPNSYTEVPLSVIGSDANIQRFLNLTNTFQDENTSNVKVILGAVFGGSGSGSYFPSLDRITVPYTTQNTIIIVEEIAGPAIGSSGGSVDTTNFEVGHLTFSNDQTIGVKSMGSIWSVLTLSFETQSESYTFDAKYMCSEEEMYDLFNDKLEQYRQQGLEIPTVTDHDTLTQAFNTIVDALFALNSEDAAITIAGFIVLMFGPSVYGPFQGFMKDSGTTLYSLIRSGDDFGMYIIDTQGQMVSVTSTLVTDIGTTKPTNISLWIND